MKSKYTKSTFKSSANRILVGLSLSVVPILVATGATASADDLLMPYIAPQHCKTTVKLPDGSGPVFYSKNCEYAMVGPSSQAQMKITGFAPSMNLMRCSAYSAQLQSIQNLEDAEQKLTADMTQLTMNGGSPAEIDKKNKQIEAIEQILNSARSRYSGIEAARAQVVMTAGIPEKQMAEIREANSQMMDQSHIVIARAPISEGYLSMTNTQVTQATQASDPAVLESSVPGFRSKVQQDATIVMNGSISGTLTLSMNGACALLKDYSYKTPTQAKVDQNKITTLLAANYTYAVPVQSGVEMNAQVDLKNALNTISNEFKTNGQFSVQDIYKLNMQGTSNEWCKVQITDYGMEGDSESKLDFNSWISTSICESLGNRLAARLETKGFLKALDDHTGAPTPNQPGGNTSTIGTSHQCHDVRLGGLIPLGSRCSDVQYQILTWHDGINEKSILFNDETSFEERQSLTMNSVIKRWFTTAFVPQQDPATSPQVVAHAGTQGDI